MVAHVNRPENARTPQKRNAVFGSNRGCALLVENSPLARLEMKPLMAQISEFGQKRLETSPSTLSFRFFPNVSGYVARGRATCKFGREFCDNPVWPEAFRLRASARAHAGVCGRVAGIDLNRRPRDCTNARELAQPRARVATAGDASHHSHGK
eukprot:6653359-Prymnesium_polylepis.1